VAKLYVSEYLYLAQDHRSLPVAAPLEPPIATQVLDTAGVHLSVALQGDFVLVSADAILSYRVSAGNHPGEPDPVATTNDMRMAAGDARFFGVKRGAKIDIIVNT
jgi:hypothetical protein